MSNMRWRVNCTYRNETDLKPCFPAGRDVWAPLNGAGVRAGHSQGRCRLRRCHGGRSRFPQLSACAAESTVKWMFERDICGFFDNVKVDCLVSGSLMSTGLATSGCCGCSSSG